MISIIIPCYNYGHLVHETLNSLKLQTCQEWECIVVDDGSSDNTAEVVLAYTEVDARYKYIYQKNMGLSAARNTGIAAAKGDFIQFLDADDLLELNKLDKQAAYLRQFTEVDIVYGNVKYFYSEAPSIYYKSVDASQTDWMPRLSGKGAPIIEALLKGNIMAVNCPLIRKSVFDRAGLFDVSFPVLEDWEMWFRCALQDVGFHYLKEKENETDALVRMHSISMTKNKWRMRLQELEWKETLHERHPEFQETLGHEIDKLRISLLLITLSNLLKGQFKTAYQQFSLLREKVTFSDLSRQGGPILVQKIKGALLKKRQNNRQPGIDAQQNAL